jgi:hypothetical protein
MGPDGGAVPLIADRVEAPVELGSLVDLERYPIA